MKTYTVNYERDEANWRVADLPDGPGCHMQRRTLEAARASLTPSVSV